MNESMWSTYRKIAYYLLESSDVDFESERGEFSRYGDPDEEIKAAKKANRVKVKKKHSKGFWKKKTNTDAGEIDPGMGGLRRTVKKLKSYGRDKARRRRVYDQVRSGSDDPSIMRNNDLVAGNSRAMMRQALGKKPNVIRYKK